MITCNVVLELIILTRWQRHLRSEIALAPSTQHRNRGHRLVHRNVRQIAQHVQQVFGNGDLRVVVKVHENRLSLISLLEVYRRRIEARVRHRARLVRRSLRRVVFGQQNVREIVELVEEVGIHRVVRNLAGVSSDPVHYKLNAYAAHSTSRIVVNALAFDRRARRVSMRHIRQTRRLNERTRHVGDRPFAKHIAENRSVHFFLGSLHREIYPSFALRIAHRFRWTHQYSQT